MRKRLLSLIVCVIMCFSMIASFASADGSTSHNWVIDLVDDSNSTVKPPNVRTVRNVWLFPGDTITFVHSDSITAGENGRTNSYTIGAQINGSAAGIEGHIATETLALGTANTDKSNTFITKITCIGTQPVFIYQSGSGCKSTDEGIAYYSMDMGYRLADVSVPVQYEYCIYDSANTPITDPVYYYDGDPVTSVLASDCTSTDYCPGTDKVIQLTHPYIEGYMFAGWKLVSACNDSDASEYSVTLNGTYNSWDTHEGETTGQTLTWTLNANPNNSAVDYGNGETIVLRAIFYKYPSLKLDACGGTIDGYSQRIYESFNSGSSTKITLSNKVPVREGYTFDGWYTDTAYSTKVTTIEELKVEGSYQYTNTLYAKWTEVGAEVYNLNGDDSVDISDLICLMKHILGYDTIATGAKPDINGDNEVNLSDCLALLRYLCS